MEMLLSNIHRIAVGVGIWYTANGLLHSGFVLFKHKGAYDRDLLRLLLDGHILMITGLMLLFMYPGFREGSSMSMNIGLLASISMLIYCAMIFPFLKSVLTILLSFFLLTVIILKLII